MTLIAMKLLIVKLMIMAAQDGRKLRLSGGGKNSQRYPPTIRPIGNAPTMHANSRCLLSIRMIVAAIKLATGPAIMSMAPKAK